jgi:hypothetical protein
MRTLLLFVITVVVVLAMGDQALMTAQMWSGIYDWRYYVNPVTSTERAASLESKGLREQIISFDEVTNLKGALPAGDVFAIGVSQVTLRKPEVIAGRPQFRPRAMETVIDTSGTFPTPPVTGDFNNVLIFDRRTGQFTKVFNARAAISRFQYGWRTTPEVLVLFGTDTDANRDGLLDANDRESAYVYSLADKRLHKIDVPNVDFYELIAIPDVDYVVVRGVVEREPSSKEPALERSPTTLIRIDLKTFAATPFVPPEIAAQLQSTLDAAPTAAPPPAAAPTEK